MSGLSAQINKYSGENPFGNYQARNFPDAKVCSEFYPISTFWSLFNEQHEIILGTRGSGKTFLLKMMRYSMLKNMSDVRGQQIVKEKKFISLYVPMHLEFISSYTSTMLSEQQQIDLFQAAFNCLLAQSLIVEIRSMLDEIVDEEKRITTTIQMAKRINHIWFNNEELFAYDFAELGYKIDKVFYSIDEKTGNIDSVPVVFKKQMCTPLLSVKSIIESYFEYKDPTWIICVDEAEFLNKAQLKCINNVFRSDSNRIALKVATLPYYHSTNETLNKGTTVAEGNDFNYRIVDMEYDSEDFKQVTNKICYERLHNTLPELEPSSALEDFLGMEGNGDLVDYFKASVKKNMTVDEIEAEILTDFSEAKRKGSENYPKKRKTIYDKYAPIFFLRTVYNISQKGNSNPGWYAGAKMTRRVAQGNPRVFINLMNELFEKAKGNKLSTKAQHEVIYKYSEGICRSTKGLEEKGPVIYRSLNYIAEKLHKKTHGGTLVTSSSSFVFKFDSEEEFEQHKEWIEVAIAHSRLSVDNEEKRSYISPETKYCLANVFSVVYWLPMRKDSPIVIKHSTIPTDNSYVVTIPKKSRPQANKDQLTFLGDESND